MTCIGWPAGMFSPERFSEPTRRWFADSFPTATDAQTHGRGAIEAGSHTLIHAPTGSGKTLAAFLWAVDQLANESTPDPGARCRVVYISPMKTLAYDIERNLRVPLAGIQAKRSASGYRSPPLPPRCVPATRHNGSAARCCGHRPTS